MTAKDLKLMIIENYIDWFTSDEEERKRMKEGAIEYVEEDHVNEISSAGFRGEQYATNKVIRVKIVEEAEEDFYLYNFEFEDGTIQEDVSNSYEGAEELANEEGYVVVDDF